MDPDMTMTFSETTTAIIPAFVKALSKMEDIPKTSRVSAGPMRYSFAPLSDVLDAVRPHLRANGLAITQVPSTAEGVYTVLWHDSGEWIKFAPLLIHPAGGTPQNVGSAITYARRYSILSILGLATEDDDGAAGSVAAAAPAEDPLAVRVDTMMRRLGSLTEMQKAEMRTFADSEGKKLSGKALYEDADWLTAVEAYVDVLDTDSDHSDDGEPSLLDEMGG